MSRVLQEKNTSSSALSGLLEAACRTPNSSLGHLLPQVPHQLLTWSHARAHGVDVTVRRDDLLHPLLSGNKFYKLWGHLRRFRSKKRFQVFASFGGAYSNHLYALAALAHLLNISSHGFIRGERPSVLSPTLQDLERLGMVLHFISRSDYSRKYDTEYQEILNNRLETCYGRAPSSVCWIPEGGGGEFGLEGLRYLGEYLSAQHSYDSIALACGTGTSVLGLAQGLDAGMKDASARLLGISALKSDPAVLSMLSRGMARLNIDWTLTSQYHCGGFARLPQYLKEFVADFEVETNLALDRVYTAKVFWALSHMIEMRLIPAGSRILVLHTGGLQGNRSLK